MHSEDLIASEIEQTADHYATSPLCQGAGLRLPPYWSSLTRLDQGTLMNETVVNVYEAKTNLSKLLERVEKGDEIVLGRAGRPIARLIAYHPQREPRVPGRLAGRIEMKPDFSETPEWLLDEFEADV